MHVPKGNKASLPRHVAVSCAQAPTGAASLVATQCHGRAWLSCLFPSTAAPMLFGKTRADLGGLGGCPDLGVWQVSLAMEASRQLERSQRGLLSLCAASDAAGPQGPSVRRRTRGHPVRSEGMGGSLFPLLLPLGLARGSKKGILFTFFRELELWGQWCPILLLPRALHPGAHLSSLVFCFYFN